MPGGILLGLIFFSLGFSASAQGKKFAGGASLVPHADAHGSKTRRPRNICSRSATELQRDNEILEVARPDPNQLHPFAFYVFGICLNRNLIMQGVFPPYIVRALCRYVGRKNLSGTASEETSIRLSPDALPVVVVQ